MDGVLAGACLRGGLPEPEGQILRRMKVEERFAEGLDLAKRKVLDGPASCDRQMPEAPAQLPQHKSSPFPLTALPDPLLDARISPVKMKGFIRLTAFSLTMTGFSLPISCSTLKLCLRSNG